MFSFKRLSVAATVASVSTLLFSAVVAQAATTQPAYPPDSTMAKIVAKGHITVGVKFAVPIFGQKNPITGEIDGFEPDIARILGKDLFGSDGHVRFVEAPGPARETIVLQGKADIVSSTYTITPERMKRIAFAGPIYFSKPIVMVRKDYKGFGDKISGYQDLNNHTVCTTANSIEAQLLAEKAPKAKVMYLLTDECAAALSQGRVDALAVDDIVAFGLVKLQPQKYRLVDNPNGVSQPYGIGMKKDHEDLCRWINKQLVVMIKDGQWQHIFDERVKKVADVTPQVPTAADMHYCK